MLTNPYRGQRPAWLPKKEADADNSITTYTLTPAELAEVERQVKQKYGGEMVPKKAVEISREGLKALIDQGLTEKDIAAKLGCSVSTVKRKKAVLGLVGYRPGKETWQQTAMKACQGKDPDREPTVSGDEVRAALTGTVIEDIQTYAATGAEEESKIIRGKVRPDGVFVPDEEPGNEENFFDGATRPEGVFVKYCPMCARPAASFSAEGGPVTIPGRKSELQDGKCLVCGYSTKPPFYGYPYKYPSTELSKAISAVDQAQRTIHSYSAVDRAVVIAEILRGIADGLDEMEGRRVEVDVTVLEVGE